MPDDEIIIATIGKIAQEALAQARRATVAGKTSRGLFLRLSTGWVIFLSFEPHRGPLTLNLQGAPGMLQDLAMGSMAGCSPEEIFFSDPGLKLSTAQARAWQAPAASKEFLSPDLRRAQLISVARLANSSPASSPPAALLPMVLGMPEQASRQNLDFSTKITRLQTACRDRQVQAIAEALGDFLGLGPGLTPSGDDLVSGYLLAAHRWGEQLTPALDFAAVNKTILARARRATSDLSASLIACAARGQADERLVLALDGIVTGTPEADTCIAALAGWGSSSGFDALVGMALYLTRL
jgi:hypothetical protein